MSPEVDGGRVRSLHPGHRAQRRGATPVASKGAPRRRAARDRGVRWPDPRMDAHADATLPGPGQEKPRHGAGASTRPARRIDEEVDAGPCPGMTLGPAESSCTRQDNNAARNRFHMRDWTRWVDQDGFPRQIMLLALVVKKLALL